MVDMASKGSLVAVVDHHHTASPTLTNHLLESLYFSMSVYEPTEEALLQDLEKRFGRVQPLMSYGFDAKGSGGQQVIFVARSLSGRVIVTCRGTCGFRDVLQDLKYVQSRLSFARGTAHWGFAERAESVPIDFLLKLLDAGEEVVFTGHSMGGAVASLLTLRVLESESNRKRTYDEQVRCITFGTPLFASTRLAEMINDKYKDLFIHIVSRRDVVPKILPWISTLQKLVYADEDHLEGLVVLKSALGFVPWLPIAPFLTALESRIPSIFKFFFRCIMKLALPSGMAGSSYAFAGHIVMLDTGMAAAALKNVDDNSLILTSAEDLNAWHSQLNFAFGSGFDVTMIEEHMLDCYHDGIVRAFSQVHLTRELISPAVAAGTDLDPSRATAAAAYRQILKSNRYSDETLVVRMVPQEGALEGCCGMPSASATTLIRAKSLASLSRKLSAGEGSWMCGHNTTTKKSRRKLERSLTMDKSSMRGSCCSHEATARRLEEGKSISKKKEGRCRACQCLRMYMNVKGSCRQVTKNFFNWGWILGTVGRVARHLKILDNLCAITFFRLVVGNILG